jgi:hypothetical protein
VDSARIQELVVNGFTVASGYGIRIQGAAATDNLVYGNYLGCDAVGEAPVPNVYGVHLSNDASSNDVGGPNVGEENVISGNSSSGVLVNTSADGNRIRGNRIGTNAVGNAAVANGSNGITLNSCSGTIIGGSAGGETNLLSGNTARGILLSSADNVSVQGNRIGTNLAVTAKIPNGDEGLYFDGSSNTITIGGPNAGEGNVISGNASGGLSVSSSVNNIFVYGNMIGTGLTGTESGLGNTGGSGVSVGSIAATPNVKIGGTASGQGNVIAESSSSGVNISGNGAGVEVTGNTIRDNGVFGVRTQADGAEIVKNLILDNGGAFDGILLAAGGTNTKVYHNTVHGNGGNGIEIADAGAILRNNIVTGNGDYGINDLSGTMTESDNLVTSATTTPANVSGRSNVALNGSDLDVDPLYVDASGGDFSLTECTSLAINAGTDLGPDQPDMNGAAAGLYNGTAPDMGTLESSCATVPLRIVKRAFLDDGIPVSTGAILPRGTIVKYLLYINNVGNARTDITVEDVLDASFAYQSETTRLDSSVFNCLGVTCTNAEEAAIFAAVDGVGPGSDAIDGDEISYNSGTTTVHVGDGSEANAPLDIPENRVVSVLFEIRIQ